MAASERAREEQEAPAELFEARRRASVDRAALVAARCEADAARDEVAAARADNASLATQLTQHGRTPRTRHQSGFGTPTSATFLTAAPPVLEELESKSRDARDERDRLRLELAAVRRELDRALEHERQRDLRQEPVFHSQSQHQSHEHLRQELAAVRRELTQRSTTLSARADESLRIELDATHARSASRETFFLIFKNSSLQASLLSVSPSLS